MDKIPGLRAILSQDPQNSFARYGLALELAGRGETDAALAEFDTLLASDPSYTPGYQMSAQILAGAGRREMAMERIKQGIQCAMERGNIHAAEEMRAMLEELDR